MKPKLAHGLRSHQPKHKAVSVIKKEMEIPENNLEGFQMLQNGKPSVEIVSCISYQKFRYSGENRPGKKYQEKDFMELKLTNLSEKVVRVVIICTDADNKELIHPNGLVGKDCHRGIYDKEYAITKQTFNIKIPYLRTERIKTKKNEHSKIRDILKDRAGHLPSPYRERCESQCTDQYTFNRKFDTTKVCLGVIVTVKAHLQGAVNGSLHAISHVVNNASEKTLLGILKLSKDQFSSSHGGLVDVFTTEDGPAIENNKYIMYVSFDDGVKKWESEHFSPSKEDILYKRIITYKIPPFYPNPNLEQDVEALLHLDCPQSNQSCRCPFLYSPHGEEFVFYETNNLKRSHEFEEVIPAKQLKLEDGQSSQLVKAGLKERIMRREDDRKNSSPVVQIRQADSQSLHDLVIQDSSEHYSIDQYSSSVQENEQGFQNIKVLTTHSYGPNTVVIITENGSLPDGIDIENAISKGMPYFEKSTKGGDDRHQLILDSSQELTPHQPLTNELPTESSQVITDPESQTSTGENQAKEEASEVPSLSPRISNQPLQEVKNKYSESAPSKETSTPVVSKKTHKTESPWAVASEDESDYSLMASLFHDIGSSKPTKSTNKKETSDNQGRTTTVSSSRVSTESKNGPVEKQKTISVLSSEGESVVKFLNKDSESTSTTQVGSIKLDFSKVSLPSDIMTLNSENLSALDVVKMVNKD